MVESKQVKVDNWGIFFLQRLQQFFNKTYFCDLTLQFENNVQLKVHRLVLNACTEYFRLLEQTCEAANNCLVMPSELQADVVVPIVNFMYTGILEFHEPNYSRLYAAAQLLNMTVLTKLLDAQKAPPAPVPAPRSPGRRTLALTPAPLAWGMQGKTGARAADPELPEPLPGRKLPVWRRRSAPGPYRAVDQPTVPDPMSVKYYKRDVDDAPRPTRFEWPEEDDSSFETSSFDEISYTSRLLALPARDKSPRPSTSNFEELKKSTVKRPATALPAAPPPTKRVNIQDVKEYLREQKLRSDYIEYDDAEAADNDLQTYNDDDSADEAPEKNGASEPAADDTPSKSILKSDSSTSHNKRVRFSLEEKENADAKPAEPATKPEPAVDMSNHTKIITEVLKKYPHLVKKNKNIRLKILAKGAASPKSAAAAAAPAAKPTSKVSYMVMKPDVKVGGNDKRDGHWTCRKCPEPNPPQFDTYHQFRTHLTDVHQEKADSQMCGVCGHTSRKQNMLVYHKYVKHGIEPPVMYHFPRCPECSYVALSPALLLKHQTNHAHGALACAQCGTSLPTKAALLAHAQATGHAPKPDPDVLTADCSYCSAKFFTDAALFTHLREAHRDDAHKDGLLSADEALDAKQEAPAQPAAAVAQQPLPPASAAEKKDKIKILSNVKITKPTSELLRGAVLPKQSEQQPEQQLELKEELQAQEPSSEAESLSNVASGIAASLGLVNTIVVLDDNQFILQPQEGAAARHASGARAEYILPDMSSMDDMTGLPGTQHQAITSEGGAIISQAALGKANIASTDELVMVLTDHDYSDASGSGVLAPNSSNIVVLYSHPVQGQDGTTYMSQSGNLMLNTEMGLMEVDEQYAVANGAALPHKQCEESIEMIQQEINSQLEPDAGSLHAHAALEEEVVPFNDNIDMVNEPQFAPADGLPAQMDKANTDEDVAAGLQDAQPEVAEAAQCDLPEQQDASFQAPIDAEESIELIQKEIDNSAELTDAAPQHVDATVPYVENVLEEQAQPPADEPCATHIQQSIEEPDTDVHIVSEEQLEDKELEETAAEICNEMEQTLEENVSEIEHSTEEIAAMPEEVPEPCEEDKSNKEEVLPDTPAGTPEMQTETCTEDAAEQSEQLQPDASEEPSIPTDLKADLAETEADLVPAETSLDDLSCVEGTLEAECEKISEDVHEEIKEVVEESEVLQQEEQEPPPAEEQQQVEEEEEQQQRTAVEEEGEEAAVPDEQNAVDSQTVEIKNEVNEVAEATEPAEEAAPMEEAKESCDKLSALTNPKISKLLDDWDDGDTDSQQSDATKSNPVHTSSINTLIDDWDEEEES